MVDEGRRLHNLLQPPAVEQLASDENSERLPVVKTVPEIKHFKVEKANVNPWVHFFAGGVAGMAGALFTSPLDVVKTRLQSDDFIRLNTLVAKGSIASRCMHHVTDTFKIIADVYKLEGPRALFKGLGPNLTGVVPARSVNFFTYTLGKDYLSRTFNDPNQSNAKLHLAAAVNAGIITSTVTNPIWLIKTRLQLDKSNQRRQYRNSWDCFKKIVRNEGFKALYRGLSASYLGTAESSIQWVLYEQMKLFIRRKQAKRAEDGQFYTKSKKFSDWFATSGAAGVAKLLASLITYPHEVIRTRLRQAPLANGEPKYRGLVHCLKMVIREEGFISMYGGLTPHLLRTVPNSIIMFGTWDLIVRVVASWN